MSSFDSIDRHILPHRKLRHSENGVRLRLMFGSLQTREQRKTNSDGSKTKACWMSMHFVGQSLSLFQGLVLGVEKSHRLNQLRLRVQLRGVANLRNVRSHLPSRIHFLIHG